MFQQLHIGSHVDGRYNATPAPHLSLPSRKPTFWTNDVSQRISTSADLWFFNGYIMMHLPANTFQPCLSSSTFHQSGTTTNSNKRLPLWCFTTSIWLIAFIYGLRLMTRKLKIGILNKTRSAIPLHDLWSSMIYMHSVRPWANCQIILDILGTASHIHPPKKNDCASVMKTPRETWNGLDGVVVPAQLAVAEGAMHHAMTSPSSGCARSFAVNC